MLTKAILQKIQKITLAVPSLIKDDNAPNANFNYVSIDTYYDKIAKLAYENGLVWIIREEEIDFQTDPEYGFIQVQTYAVDLYDVDSGDGQVEAIKLTISHPFQDAQTTGSSLSYLDKLVMRQLFKVVTGEKDADFYARGRNPKGKSNAQAQPPTSKPAAAKPATAAKPTPVKEKEVVDTVEETFDTASAENPDNDGKEGIDVDEIVAAFKGATTAAGLSQARLQHDEGVRQLKKLALTSNEWTEKLAKVQEVYKTKYNELNG